MPADAVCRKVGDALSETAGGELPPGAERDHLERCLRCQATAVRFRRLDRELVALGADRLQPPDDLLAETLELLRSGSNAVLVKPSGSKISSWQKTSMRLPSAASIICPSQSVLGP